MRSYSMYGLGVATWQSRTTRAGLVSKRAETLFDVDVGSEPGDSGGPAIGAHGKVHGVVSTVSDSATQIARIDMCAREVAEVQTLAME